MGDHPHVTYHLWQSIKGRGGRETLREADYTGYAPASTIAVEDDVDVVYFPQAKYTFWGRSRRNTVVAAEKRVDGRRDEFAFLNGGPLLVTGGIQPRLSLVGKRELQV